MDKLNEADQINKLLDLLKEEFKNLDLLIGEMSAVESPLKNEFVFMKTIQKNRRFVAGNLEKNVTLLIQELEQFASILNKILENDEVSESYVKAGLLEKAMQLRDNITSKFSF